MYTLILILFVTSIGISKVYCARSDSGLNQFPFFAELIIPTTSPAKHGGGNILYNVCGATLVHPRWLLTAARCFPNDTLTLKAIESSINNEVSIGIFKNINPKNQNSIIKIYRHPRFHWIKIGNAEVVHHDIAVVKLRTAFKISESIKTIRLPPSKKENIARFVNRCKKGVIMGTGRSSTHYPTFDQKFPWLKVSRKRRTELSASMPNSDHLFYSETFIQPMHGLQDNKGGPFLCNNSGLPIQYGVMSEQVHGKRTIVTTFEDLGKHMDFIKKIVPDLNAIGQRRSSIVKSIEEVDKAGVCNLTPSLVYVFLLLVCCFMYN